MKKMAEEYDILLVTQEGEIPIFTRLNETAEQVVNAVFTALDRYLEQAA